MLETLDFGDFTIVNLCSKTHKLIHTFFLYCWGHTHFLLHPNQNKHPLDDIF